MEKFYFVMLRQKMNRTDPLHPEGEGVELATFSDKISDSGEAERTAHEWARRGNGKVFILEPTAQFTLPVKVDRDEG